MALVKCKECGGEVSNKAKTCPKCGAKVPVKTSALSWFVLALIIFVAYTASQNPSAPTRAITPTISTSPQKAEEVKAVAKPSWVSSTSKDEMTGEFSAYATSPVVAATKAMSFPYHNVSSWIGVGCNSKSKWVYFGFSDAPNLANDTTQDGYNSIRTRIKWNEKVEEVSLTQDWGAKFIHFTNGTDAISNISASNTALLELQWHGQQPAYFNYSLNGSSKAISEVSARCATGK